MDGTVINDIQCINPSTFTFKTNEPQWYFILNDNNFIIAFLEKDDLLEAIYIDYCLQNYSFNGEGVRFRIGEWKKVHAPKIKKGRRY